MSLSSEKQRSIQEKLKDTYRLVVIDDDTLKEVKSTKFSIMGIVLGFILSVFIISAITSCLIAFTPLKHLVPGYADINNNAVYVELSQKIESLEKDLEVQKVYTDGFKKILNPTGLKLDEPTGISNKIDKFSIDYPYYEKISNHLSIEHYYFCSPLKGEVSADFDLEKSHYGIDLVAPENTAILNILDGVVINADWSDQTGHTISVQHKGNMVSIFKHNSVLLKRIGDHVKKGEAIAVIGNTGELTSGPHVHFELWFNGSAVNPNDYISFN
jgi:murein DD-endopeptidase MepM/ murein hydrolase activator NlpD